MHDARRACVCTPPLLCYRCCPGRHIRLSVGVVVTSTRHIRVTQQVDNQIALLISCDCDCDRTIEAKDTGCATSDAAMQTKRKEKKLEGLHAFPMPFFRAKGPPKIILEEKQKQKRASIPCDILTAQHSPNSSTNADKDSVLDSLKRTLNHHQRETVQTVFQRRRTAHKG